MNASVVVFLAFVLGITSGAVIDSNAVAAALEPVGTLWINAIRMPVIPLLFALTVVGIAGSRDTRAARRITIRALLIFVALLTVFTAVSTIAAPALLGGLTIDPASTAALRSSVTATPGGDTPITFVGWLTSLIPVNPVGAVASGALLPMVVFALLYGLALSQLREEQRAFQVTLFEGIADTLMRIIRWVLALAPVGIFALAFVLGVRVGLPAAGAVAWYLAVACTATLVVLGLLYLLMVTSGRARPREIMAALLPAQLVALSSRSSVAALPALIDGFRTRLHLSPQVTGIVLPLAASVFKINAAATWAFGAVFVSKLYGVPLDTEQLIIFGIGTVLLSFTVPGIPSGGFLVQAPLYVTVGLPPEGLGVLIAIDLLLDICKTTCNVTGFAAVAVLVAGRESPSAPA